MDIIVYYLPSLDMRRSEMIELRLDGSSSMAKNRTAVLVRCTPEEADAIRRAAKRERRSISGFVLNAVMNRIANQATIQQRLEKMRPSARAKERPS